MILRDTVTGTTPNIDVARGNKGNLLFTKKIDN